LLRQRLEKRRNDDVVAEPWVQCDRCRGWVHQVCAMFNARKNALLPFNAEYCCPLCRREEAQKKRQAEAAAAGPSSATSPRASSASAAAAAAAGSQHGTRKRSASNAGPGLSLSVAVPLAPPVSIVVPVPPHQHHTPLERTSIIRTRAGATAPPAANTATQQQQPARSPTANGHGPITVPVASPWGGTASASGNGSSAPSTRSGQQHGAAASASAASAAASSHGHGHGHGHGHAIVLTKYEGAHHMASASVLGVGSADVAMGAGGTPVAPLPGASPAASGSSYYSGVPGASPPAVYRAVAAPDDDRGGLYDGSLTSTAGVGNASTVLAASADPYATASSLPHTPLSIELENRVRERLQHCAGAEVAASVVVRVVSSLRKNIVVPPEVRQIYTAEPPATDVLISVLATSAATGSTAVESVASPVPRDGSAKIHTSAGGGAGTGAGAGKAGPRFNRGGSGVGAPAPSPRGAPAYAEQYTYRQRVVLLWQRLDGVDVCLFALYVQEHGAGPDCPQPNRRKVYIAYLDSVRYLRPATARTAIYHELLAAYLSNARARGYERAYIWACPPQRGDGYIFHVHPPSQRVPGKERLREWYDEMLAGMMVRTLRTPQLYNETVFHF
jgi:hypothetical protein